MTHSRRGSGSGRKRSGSSQVTIVRFRRAGQRLIARNLLFQTFQGLPTLGPLGPRKDILESGRLWYEMTASVGKRSMQTGTSNGLLREVRFEEGDCSFPGEFCLFGIVAGCRVVVETVVGFGIHVHRVGDLVCLEILFVVGPAGVYSLV